MYRTIHLDEVEPVTNSDPGEARWLPVRHRLGVSAFGVNAWQAREEGDEVIEEHDERHDGTAQEHEELYFVARGHARFRIGDEQVEAPEGTFVFLPDPGVVRAATGTEGTTVLAIGAPAGQAYEVSPWEAKYL